MLQGTGAGPVVLLSAAFRANAAGDEAAWADVGASGRLPRVLAGPDDALRLALLVPARPAAVHRGQAEAGSHHAGAGALRAPNAAPQAKAEYAD